MRALALVLLVAAPLRAQDGEAAALARDALDREDYGAALARAAEGLRTAPDDGTLLYLQAEARCGRARALQRNEGYAAALEALEPHAGSHRMVTEAYARTALWAGEEERALRVLPGVLPEPRERVALELELLAHLRRYREAAERSRAAGWEDGAVWAEKRAALQERLAGRARRGRTVAAVAAAVLLGLGAVLFRIAPASRPATS